MAGSISLKDDYLAFNTSPFDLGFEDVKFHHENHLKMNKTFTLALDADTIDQTFKQTVRRVYQFPPNWLRDTPNIEEVLEWHPKYSWVTKFLPNLTEEFPYEPDTPIKVFVNTYEQT